MSTCSEQYWEERNRNLAVPVGKSIAVEYARRMLAERSGRVRVLDIGTGTGCSIASLASVNCSEVEIVAIDKNSEVLRKASSQYPHIDFKQHDILGDALLDCGTFDLIIAVNSFHEVFSELLKRSGYSVSHSKIKLNEIIVSFGSFLRKGGTYIIFDGLEPLSGDKLVKMRLITQEAVDKWIRFQLDYAGFSLGAVSSNDQGEYELSYSHFVRFVTKFKWIGGVLWPIESRETYQYFTEAEFVASITQCGCEVVATGCYISNVAHWKEHIEITSDATFPYEYHMIAGRRI